MADETRREDPADGGRAEGLEAAAILLRRIADYWDGRPLAGHGAHIYADLMDALRAIEADAAHNRTLAADRETHPTTRLTDEESARIVSASIAPDRVLAGRDGHEGSPPDVLLVEVERILAERTLAADREPDGPRADELAAHPATDQPTPEPHAYAVEALWNQGTRSEHWRRAMEMGDVREPLTLDGARGLMADMIADGHAPDAVRVVAITVATDHPEVDRG